MRGGDGTLVNEMANPQVFLGRYVAHCDSTCEHLRDCVGDVFVYVLIAARVGTSVTQLV